MDLVGISASSHHVHEFASVQDHLHKGVVDPAVFLEQDVNLRGKKVLYF